MRDPAAAALLACSLAGVAAWVPPAASQAVAPPSTYEWVGECPVRSCRYGEEWTAPRDLPVWSNPDDEPPGSPAFMMRFGERVRAVTGTLRMLAPGLARMREDFSTDASYPSLSARHRQTITLRAGEEVHLLAPRGDRYWRIWRSGQAIDANLFRVDTVEACREPRAGCAGVIERAPVTRWIVMVMNARGLVGWVDGSPWVPGRSNPPRSSATPAVAPPCPANAARKPRRGGQRGSPPAPVRSRCPADPVAEAPERAGRAGG